MFLLGIGVTVGNILGNNEGLEDDSAIGSLEGRNLAIRVDLLQVVLGTRGLEVNVDEFMFLLGLLKGDQDAVGVGAGNVVVDGELGDSHCGKEGRRLDNFKGRERADEDAS